MGSWKERAREGEAKKRRVLGGEHKVLRDERASCGIERWQKVQRAGQEPGERA